MTVGQPRNWLTNDTISSTRWNQETRDQANGQFFKPSVMVAKTFVTEWDTSRQSLGLQHSLSNVEFDKVVYDRSWDGSKMAYGSTLMVNIPGYYLVRGRFTWGTGNSFNNATPANGTRHLGIGVNACGKWQLTRFQAPVQSQNAVWVSDPPISPSGFTALVQPVRAQARLKLARGDEIELFAAQDSGEALFDAPVDNSDTPQSVVFTIWLAAEWRGRVLS